MGVGGPHRPFRVLRSKTKVLLLQAAGFLAWEER
jgi:hypothetical protein